MDSIFSIVEDIMKSLISKYFLQLTGMEINFKSRVEYQKIINYIKENKLNLNYNYNSILESTESESINLYSLFETFRLIYLPIQLDKDKKLEQIVFQNLITEILFILKKIENFNFEYEKKESILFEDGYILRFIQNLFYFFKEIKFPKEDVQFINDQQAKDMNIALKSSMEINLLKEHSFCFEYSCLKNKTIDFSEVKFKDNKKRIKTENDRDLEHDLLSNQKKEKLISYKFNIFTDDY